MINRNLYLTKLIDNMNNGLPKVVTGIRRCGKSFLLNNIFKEYLLSKGIKEKNIIYIDLLNISNAELKDPINLNKFVLKLLKNNEKYYVFIDEIQEVYSIVNPALTGGKHILATKNDKEIISFVDVILGLSSNERVDLYVTGSNSKMLSSEIETKFRGKSTVINLLPLSFEEFVSYKGGDVFQLLNEYITFGGMPLAVLSKSESDKRDYLQGLFQTIYFKDILDHNKLNKSESLDELINIISELVGDLVNAEKIANAYQSIKHENIDKETVSKILNFFIDAFIIKEAKRYDLKGKREIGAQRKYYFVDSGLRNASINFAFSDKGKLLENVVYNELIYNGFNVNVGVFDNMELDENKKVQRKHYEIDFYAVKDNRRYYIQVCNNLNDKKVHDREIRPYQHISEEATKIIVVNDYVSECRDEHGFVIINACDFLLKFVK